MRRLTIAQTTGGTHPRNQTSSVFPQASHLLNARSFKGAYRGMPRNDEPLWQVHEPSLPPFYAFCPETRRRCRGRR